MTRTRKTISALREKLGFHKEMHTHYRELYEVAAGELKFEKMNVSYLMSVIDELHTLGDPVIKAVIENSKNRHNLDKIIHANKIFDKGSR